MMVDEYVDYNRCPDCGEPREVCQCDQYPYEFDGDEERISEEEYYDWQSGDTPTFGTPLADILASIADKPQRVIFVNVGEDPADDDGVNLRDLENGGV